MTDRPPLKCTMCGETGLEEGFLEDLAQGNSYGKWIPGPLQLGILGGPKVFGKPRFAIEAWRCTACSHLELFVATQ